jgi:NADH-quinone oxidoreductase subunit J
VSVPQLILATATLLGALGMWLLLPRGAAGGRLAGAVLAMVALGLGLSQLPGLGDWIASSVFGILAGVTVIAAAGTVTFRNPVYCALWFGLSLLGTAGLFLFNGAQFLAVSTIVVYAGAILVTFLFVLMLAEPGGKANYDRTSWEALMAAATGAVIVGILSMTVASVFTGAARLDQPLAAASEAALGGNVLAPQHMAHLGGELFGRHLIAVEVAGTLLLATLVGAAAMVAQGKIKTKDKR